MQAVDLARADGSMPGAELGRVAQASPQTPFPRDRCQGGSRALVHWLHAHPEQQRGAPASKRGPAPAFTALIGGSGWQQRPLAGCQLGRLQDPPCCRPQLLHRVPEPPCSWNPPPRQCQGLGKSQGFVLTGSTTRPTPKLDSHAGPQGTACTRPGSGKPLGTQRPAQSWELRAAGKSHQPARCARRPSPAFVFPQPVSPSLSRRAAPAARSRGSQNNRPATSAFIPATGALLS